MSATASWRLRAALLAGVGHAAACLVPVPTSAVLAQSANALTAPGAQVAPPPRPCREGEARETPEGPCKANPCGACAPDRRCDATGPIPTCVIADAGVS